MRAVTDTELIEQLRAVGVTPGMVLVVHTSFRQVRPVEGGPRALINALTDALGPHGTLVMPTMSGSRARTPFDPMTTPTDTHQHRWLRRATSSTSVSAL